MDQGVESSIAQSLLSLSRSPNADPIMVPSTNTQQELSDSLLFGNGSGGSFGGASDLPGSTGSGSVGNPSHLKHHRRLSSTGKTRRRLSDARDAASRPSPASLSLSGLSLNSPPHTNVPLSTSFTSAIGASSPVNIAGQGQAQAATGHEGLSGSVGSVSSSIPGLHGNGLPASVDNYKSVLSGGVGSAPAGTIVKPVPIAKNGKKRGMDHKCESCSKVYRHPSCLIKHRWEHTPHWRESSKYVLSKHQQVQLLEAAAILSHLSSDSATGTSLPEDRSLWPSFLSGGTLPLPEGSCSVPATSSTRATSTGPRLHDYAISAADAVKVRPGLVVANGNGAGSVEQTNVTVKGSTPIPVPNGTEVYGYGYGYGRAASSSVGNSGGRGKSWGDQSPNPHYARSGSVPRSSGAAGASVSLPRSSLRSASSSSASGSGSGGRSGSSELEDDEEVEDEEEEENDINVDVVDVDGGISGKMRYPYEYDTGVRAGMKPMKEEEEDWEMEMDMD
ncbi:hypothetical protein V5O48_010469 [Marasmius crinis-equi]|uniref:C2H2-type domain-containing protein n=1 Tax=Marasmius crinis-equi TaxID=585013 RepID=A0ABR3F8A0_9AGAR